MKNLALALALMLAICVARASSGSKVSIVEECPIGISLSSLDKIGPDGSWPVAVRVWSLVHSGNDSGVVRIFVSPEAKIVEGALRKVVHPGKGWEGPGDKGWLLRLRKKRNGLVEIRAALRLPGRGPADRYDYERRMVLHVSGTSVVTKEGRVSLQVKTENGRRFRYGSTFSVALDPDDPGTPVKVDAPPEILSEAVVKVKTRKSIRPIQGAVNVAVTVSKSGKVTWIHPRTIDTSTLSDDNWKEVTTAVAGFLFRPARSGGRPVTENAVIRIRLIPVLEDK